MKVVNLVFPIDGNDLENPNVVKAITDNNLNINFFSRSHIPFNSCISMRQLGMIGFTNKALKVYSTLMPTSLEETESIDMMRFLENDYSIQGVLSSCSIFGIDNPEDIIEKDYEALDSTPSLDKRLTLSEEDAIRAQFMQCWSIPLGIPYDDTMVVKIKIFLNTDGSLLKPPEVVQHERMNKPSEKYFRTLAESALRAVRRCDPIKLPDPERYDNWKNLQLNFDPREILRS